MREKGNGWIYVNPYPEYEELFKRIEAALGFKLFTWQKSFIVLGHFRRYGGNNSNDFKRIARYRGSAIRLHKAGYEP